MFSTNVSDGEKLVALGKNSTILLQENTLETLGMGNENKENTSYKNSEDYRNYVEAAKDPVVFGRKMRNSIVKQNNHRIFVGEQGSMVKNMMYRRGLFRYYSDETGVIYNRGYFSYQEQDFEANQWGHVSRAKGIPDMDYDKPLIYQNDKNYKRGDAAYFYRKLYYQVGKIMKDVSGFPKQENLGHYLSPGSIIYQRVGEEGDYYYVHDVKTNGFFQYIPF